MPAAATPASSNAEIAAALERVADLYEAQGADPFRVRAWRAGADLARTFPAPLADVHAEGGLEALDSLPGIGKTLASAIEEILHSGRLAVLDRLEGEVSPEDLFASVPGIGETMARRIHDRLGLDTLEDLEVAAHDGRLEQVPGVGPRRAHAVREVLAGMLARSSRRRARRFHLLDEAVAGRRKATEAERLETPPVSLLLQVDAAYRRAAVDGTLRRIAPRRFNPKGEAWLPVLHEREDGWSITALFSNSARAHQLGKTRDWVVIYYEKEGHEDQATVVTEHSGELEGERVVRGREAECLAWYQTH